MSASLDEPAIPRLRRPLAAVWISLGLHAAVIALVQVAPPATFSISDPLIEARLVPAAPQAGEPQQPPADGVDEPPATPPLLAPSEAPDPLPVAEPIEMEAAASESPAEAEPSAEVEPAAQAEPLDADTSAEPPAAAPAPSAAITTTVDLTYYSARELDVQPRALREILPDYPPDADRQRLSGAVRLQLKLEADGRIGGIEVVGATPPGVFEESALRAFREARFAPAQRNGRPVRARVVIEVVYDWEGRARAQ